MSNYKRDEHFPTEKRILMTKNVQKCPEDMTASFSEGEPLASFAHLEIQSESRGGIGLPFDGNTLSEPSLKTLDRESIINVSVSEVDAETDENGEHINAHSVLEAEIDKFGLHINVCSKMGCKIVETSEHSDVQPSSNGLAEDSDCIVVDDITTIDNTSVRDSDSEVHVLLDDGVTEQNGSAENVTCEFAEKLLTMEDHNNNNNQSLPDGWVRVLHDSGCYVYHHTESNVVTTCQPYTLGPGSARRHKVPVSAIPCLNEKRQKEMADGADKGNNLVSDVQIHAYCKNLFKFKTSKVFHYSSWKNKRLYDSLTKRYKKAKQPFTRTVNLPVKTVGGKDIFVPFIIENKSYLMLLYEYVNFAFKKQVDYRIEHFWHQGEAFLATAYIGGTRYGSGIGNTKKLAKNEAARLALSVILGFTPELNHQLREVGEEGASDDVNVVDPRVVEVCKETNVPLPFAMLQTLLARDENLKGLEVRHKIIDEGLIKKYVMEVGHYSATVRCCGKTDGKQRAAQEILKRIHPLVRSWGGLVRLYRASYEGAETKPVGGLGSEDEDEKKKREVDRGVIDNIRRQLTDYKEEIRARRAEGNEPSRMSLLLPGLFTFKYSSPCTD